MEKLKQSIEKEKNNLYEYMQNDEYVSPDMLDYALSVISKQDKYIEKLEEHMKKS